MRFCQVISVPAWNSSGILSPDASTLLPEPATRVTVPPTPPVREESPARMCTPPPTAACPAKEMGLIESCSHMTRDRAAKQHDCCGVKPGPTFRFRSPPAPLEEMPDTREIEPEFPRLEVPVRSSMSPLYPETPEFADWKSNEGSGPELGELETRHDWVGLWDPQVPGKGVHRSMTPGCIQTTWKLRPQQMPSHRCPTPRPRRQQRGGSHLQLQSRSGPQRSGRRRRQRLLKPQS